MKQFHFPKNNLTFQSVMLSFYKGERHLHFSVQNFIPTKTFLKNTSVNTK